MTITQFEALLEQHGDSIFGFCYHLMGNKADAEDLYQDSVVKAFEKLEVMGGLTHGELGRARNYIIGIAVRLHRNYQRKMLRNGSDPDGENAADQLYEQTDIVAETEQKDIREATRKIVSGLPDKLRVVIIMFYYAEMSVAEISEELRLPLGTVKSRLNRARAQVKTELEENDYGPEKKSFNKKFA